MDGSLFHNVLIGWLVIAALSAIGLLFRPAPYGRYVERGWGAMIPARIGWSLIESPALIAFLVLFFTGSRMDTVSVSFLAMWLLHYTQRSAVYPLRYSGTPHPIPLLMVVFGALFNLTHGSLQGLWLYRLAPGYGREWLTDPRFIVGAVLFVGGFLINLRTDTILLELRRPGETGYRIPQGGLFRYVSCPNYLGEIIEWVGWAIATWSLAGLSIAVWTIANLAPRARSHHRWYHERFPDYPPQRKALGPFLF